MSENKPLYDRFSHPHAGDPRVDPEARYGFMGQPEKKNPVKKKETWYTAHPGITYRTGRFGSDAGTHAGTIEQDTPIRVISKSKPVNGIVSIFAEFKVGDEVAWGWFSMDDVRGGASNIKRRKKV